MTAKSTALAIAPQSVCVKCGTSLPEGSQFCLKCGQPVVAVSQPESRSKALAPMVVQPPGQLSGPVPTRPRTRRSRALWYAIPLLLGVVWVWVSSDPIAQQVRDEATGARAQTIIEAAVSVKPQSFVYYEFSVPSGAVAVGVTGQFSSKGLSGKKPEQVSDNNVEAYVLTDSAFVVWRKGFSTGSLYESGRSSQENINAPIPSGSGIYYLVFDNRFSSRTEKTVQATVLLHYQTWVPGWLLRMKEKMWRWFGLD